MENKAAKSASSSSYRRGLRRVCRVKPHLVIIFLISLIGFCYHFYLAFNQFLEFKTNVSFGYESPKNGIFEYPSITLCFPDIIPHFHLQQLFPEYAEAVRNISEEQIRRKDANFWTTEESAKFNVFGLKGKYLYKFFAEKVFKNQTVLEILENLSFGESDECLLDAKPNVENGYSMTYCSSVRNQVLKSLNGDFRNISQVHHPFDTAWRARVLVHSPFALPVPSFYPSIPLYEWSRFYDISFAKTISHLLEAPYQTNCRNYGNYPNETQSSDDCFAKCLTQEYRRECRCLPRSGVLFRPSLLRSEDRFCEKINKCQFTNYRQKCSEKCQKDCLEQTFTAEKFADIPFFARNNMTGVQLSRQPVDDAVYRHSPAVTLIQLICDFGGLGGLWLGFSVITITTAIIQLISRPLERRLNSEDD
ncbi:degenerin deg-1-like isoform X2 [Oppia nitens]|uniref:degenerin deg-1-like isoform X2 n=1 Tax=Oppia nitens TaxID=1686743 RepID=UPI0023DBBB8A|nr:degenerin deg-1-like isoform X2 [Oppia nitens]